MLLILIYFYAPPLNETRLLPRLRTYRKRVHAENEPNGLELLDKFVDDIVWWEQRTDCIQITFVLIQVFE